MARMARTMVQSGDHGHPILDPKQESRYMHFTWKSNTNRSVARAVITPDTRPGGHGFEPSDLPILLRPLLSQLSVIGKTGPSTSRIDISAIIIYPELS
jgi:hypothetical protein